MAYLDLQWNIEGEKQLHNRLRVAAEAVKDWTPAFKETAVQLKQVFSADVFATEGGAVDESWAPLSPAYAKRKARQYPGKGLLQATGKMQDSFMTLWKPDMAMVWNTCDYFKYHQSNKPRHVLPRRLMMKLAQQQRTDVVKIFHTYFVRKIRQK